MLHLEVASKKIKFRVCACQWLGPSIIAKLHIKNGAMLYIMVLLWTPAECMQRGTLKRRKKVKIDVLLLFSNGAASQRCWTFTF